MNPPTNRAYSMPALFIFSLGINGEMKFESCVSFDGNLIDLTFLQCGSALLYSMDATHMPLSTTIVDGGNARRSVGVLESTDIGWKMHSENHKNLVDSMEKFLAHIPDVSQIGSAKGKSMRDLLYNLESLRKREPEE